MRDGTPSGFSTISTGVPSARYGMSSSGRMRESTPLLPWRPGHLVADLQPALDRDEHLDHLDHARREFVARLQPVELGAVMILHRLDVRVHRRDRVLGLCLRIRARRGSGPIAAAAARRAPRREIVSPFLSSTWRSSDITRPASFLPAERLFQLAQRLLPDDADFFGLVCLEALGLEHFEFPAYARPWTRRGARTPARR